MFTLLYAAMADTLPYKTGQQADGTPCMDYTKWRSSCVEEIGLCIPFSVAPCGHYGLQWQQPFYLPVLQSDYDFY